MLKGLEISEVSFLKIDLGDRFDAEFFDKKDLFIEKRLKQLNSLELRVFGKFVASAFYPAATHLYEHGDLPFIRCVDGINYPLITKFQDDDFEKIPTSFAKGNSGINFLKQGDMVVTKVGTPCYASVIYEHKKVALSRTVLGMCDIKNINKYYLLMFLRSKYGFTQLQRHRELTIQYQLTLERTKKVLVFLPSSEFQSKIEELTHQQIQILNLSKSLYMQSEQLLLDELGLKSWQPSADNINTKSFKESFSSTGRLDAEYYQPKYELLLTHLKQFDTKKLGLIVKIQKSIEPGSEAYQDKGIPFMRVSNLSKFGITDTEIHLNKGEYQSFTPKPKKDTILLTKDGSVGIAFKVENDLDVVTSSALLHLTVADDEFLPDYLTLVLNSIVVKLQAERDAGGSIIQHWKPSEIEQIVIPKLPINKQHLLAEKIQKSFKLKHQSEHLLEVAKHAVEIAIEQDEKAATQYIQQNTKEV